MNLFFRFLPVLFVGFLLSSESVFGDTMGEGSIHFIYMVYFGLAPSFLFSLGFMIFDYTKNTYSERFGILLLNFFGLFFTVLLAVFLGLSLFTTASSEFTVMATLFFGIFGRLFLSFSKERVKISCYYFWSFLNWICLVIGLTPAVVQNLLKISA